ncbi:hypothetical protein L596_027851 [Steinernema carpocapsae]|uniref:Uncharacterized protein n=1 Tax=Steinernema carpocapsae TaxID=34508 RepID=A0A4U5LWQ1_STECR|nr:hypothetical protein L596_027851 [Steinernema carpocapsae]
MNKSSFPAAIPVPALLVAPSQPLIADARPRCRPPPWRSLECQLVRCQLFFDLQSIVWFCEVTFRFFVFGKMAFSEGRSSLEAPI